MNNFNSTLRKSIKKMSAKFKINANDCKKKLEKDLNIKKVEKYIKDNKSLKVEKPNHYLIEYNKKIIKSANGAVKFFEKEYQQEKKKKVGKSIQEIYLEIVELASKAWMDIIFIYKNRCKVIEKDAQEFVEKNNPKFKKVENGLKILLKVNEAKIKEIETYIKENSDQIPDDVMEYKEFLTSNDSDKFRGCMAYVDSIEYLRKYEIKDEFEPKHCLQHSKIIKTLIDSFINQKDDLLDIELKFIQYRKEFEGLKEKILNITKCRKNFTEELEIYIKKAHNAVRRQVYKQNLKQVDNVIAELDNRFPPKREPKAQPSDDLDALLESLENA